MDERYYEKCQDRVLAAMNKMAEAEKGSAEEWAAYQEAREWQAEAAQCLADARHALGLY